MNALIKILIAATFSVLTFFGTASAALLGNTLGLPMTFFPTGTVGYNAVTDQLSLSATPASTLFPPITNHVGGTLSINVVVDSAGNVVGGVPGDDLIMTGSVGAFASPLLTGEVLEFGSLDSGGPTDTIDFRFQITGGSLAALYGASDIGVVVTVEQSNFTGDFNFDWGGIAKGNVGPIPPRQDPCIDIEKEVSVDGGSTWFDADTVNLAPGTELAAQYRLIVTNCGPIALTNVTINDIDPTLGEPIPFIDVNIGNLAPGETKTFADPNAPGFGGLDQPQRCANPMPPEKLNTAKVKGFADDGTGRMVMDDDPAWVRCQCVDIEKEVSVDGGVTWFDADTVPQSPGTDLAAEYRLIVKNCGATDLTNVTLIDIDPTIGEDVINFNVNIGTLTPGEMKTLTKNDAGSYPDFGNLDQPQRCENPQPPEKLNTAKVITDEGPMDDDPAWVRCACVDLEKEVSVDGGITWFDADTADLAPTTGLAAEYRLIVTNCGATELTDVTLLDIDPTTGEDVINFNVNIGSLAPGTSMTFTKADAASYPDFTNLDQPQRCLVADPPEKLNTAKVTTNEGPMDDDPAWIACAGGCRFTGGGVDTSGNWDHTLESGEMIHNGAGNLPPGVDRYQFGGQAGANTGSQPQPKGEWTHHQQTGPSGDFTFHGGTASAPAGTEIDVIRCSDPGFCFPARPAPVKQLDFDGIGTFKNIGKGKKAPMWMIANPTVTAEGNGNKNFDGTFHWFEVNIDDLGEPGRKNDGAPDTAICPSLGFGEKGPVELANCDCPDYYRITIYDGVDAADVVRDADGNIDPSSLDTTTVLYEVYGYIDGGNLQIHPPTGFDTK